ncbi:glycoside hydrolase [Hesseltinella vesiculosa]|uniref:Glycoside hydrolase n=1 Tax=Hesseltinella vesiculosa TaxID=101127 RepID=A0A1X2GK72_9FUNG|nr:glycoside hydrolase [Hesseltinella vesiculosa]
MLASAFAKPNAFNPRLTAYVTDWDMADSIAWEKLDQVIYAFGVPDKTGRIGQFDTSQLKSVVEDGHSHEKLVSLSIGGWTGSVYFSFLMRTAANRKQFASNLIHVMDKYDLDGFNLDWEFPNADNGVSCNLANPADTDNYLMFLQLLRAMMTRRYPQQHKLLTVAAPAKVFNGPTKSPLKRLSHAWATTVDAIYIMAYDLHGTWDPTTGANSPLDGEALNIKTAMNDWIQAGIPRRQLVLGVPFYGYMTKTHPKAHYTTSMQIPLAPNKVQVRGDQYDRAEREPCAGASKVVYSGEYQWRSIKQDGIMENNGGWHSIWDRKTLTPYSINKSKNLFLSFDDPRSLKKKAEFVQRNGLGGIMIWSLEMDDDSDSLLNAIQLVRT